MDSGSYTGTLIAGRYSLRRELGAGGMGVVYEAWQEDLRRPVAVKLVHHASPEAIARFQREAQAAAALGHPHIVQVLDFGMTPGQPPFLVMELLNGQSLAQLVRGQGPMSGERAARLGVQVLSALEAAHGAGIIHRDIKPANLFVTLAPTLGEVVKVLDFGIAKMTGPDMPSLTQNGNVMGTLSYMAPEQAAGLEVDGRADLFALAASLYFACSGQRPTPVEMNGQGPPRLDQVVPGFSPSLASVIHRGLARERDRRFVSAAEMAHALNVALAGGTASGPVSSAYGPPSAAFGPASMAHAPASMAHAPASTGYGPTQYHGPQPTGPASMGPASLASGQYTPSFAPPAPKKSSTGCIAGAGLLVVGGAAAAALAGAFYYFDGFGLLDATPSPSATASATASAPDAGVVATTETGTAASGDTSTSGTKPARGGSGTSAGATGLAGTGGSTSAPNPTAAGATDASAAASGKKALGAPCGGGEECPQNAKCVGTCQCNQGLEACGGKCTLTDFDPQHCGTCGRACKTGEACQRGSCVPCNGTICNFYCVNTSTDRQHCGKCGNDCGPKKFCSGGQCVAAQPAGTPCTSMFQCESMICCSTIKKCVATGKDCPH